MIELEKANKKLEVEISQLRRKKEKWAHEEGKA